MRRKNKLRRFCRNRGNTEEIEIHPKPLMTKESKIFTIGSCFAANIRDHLRENGYHILEVDPFYDPDNYVPVPRQKNKSFNEWEGLMWYNTYSLKYEFQLAARKEFYRGEEDYWPDTSRGWQDAIRRLQFSDTKEGLIEKIKKVDQLVIDGIRNADLIIITLGLCEAFRSTKGEKHVMCTTPKYGPAGGRGGSYKPAEYEFVDYNQNMINLSAIMAYLLEVNEKAQVVISVSPVPFKATVRKDHEHFVANTESKSCLRAVAGRLEHLYDNVTYFPSYEMVMSKSRHEGFIPDGRHVRPTRIKEIMENFEKAHIQKFDPNDKRGASI